MKKLLAVILTVAMVFAFTACGGGSTDENGLSTVQAGKLHMATNAAFPPYPSSQTDSGLSVAVMRIL